MLEVGDQLRVEFLSGTFYYVKVDEINWDNKHQKANIIVKRIEKSELDHTFKLATIKSTQLAPLPSLIHGIFKIKCTKCNHEFNQELINYGKVVCPNCELTKYQHSSTTLNFYNEVCSASHTPMSDDEIKKLEEPICVG